jgi:hypothetical protein
MTVRTLVIQPQKEGKGRSFIAALLGYATADSLWAGGVAATDAIRPVWMAIAASEGEIGPFVANLRCGRKAEIANPHQRRPDVIELLRSAGYAWSSQRFPEGSLVTAYLPELFRLDPGMVDPSGARFVVLAPSAWCAEQRANVDAAVRHVRAMGMIAAPDRKESYSEPAPPTAEEVAELAPLASLFAAYLDRRTRAPLIPDHRFHTQLLVACLMGGLASLSAVDRGYARFGQHTKLGFRSVDLETVGMAPGVAFQATHERIEELLAEQVAKFYRKAA